MNLRLISMLVAMSCAMAGLAYAQDAEVTEGGGGGGGVVYEEETTYDFDGDTVEGALLRPDGELMSGRQHGKESSLIDIRADFIPEMVRSVNEL